MDNQYNQIGQRSIQFGGQSRGIIGGASGTGIRSKPVVADHMIINRRNDIPEEDEDIDDEHEYNKKYISGHSKLGTRIS